MRKACIFDLDGTLISERAYIYGCFRNVAGSIERKYNIDSAYKKMITLFQADWHEIFNRLFAEEGIVISNQELMDLVKLYRATDPVVEVYSDVVKALEFLKSHNQKVGLYSNGYTNTQMLKILKSGLQGYFDFVMLPDEFGKDYWKPDPRCGKKILESLEVEPQELILIGDSNTDFLTSKGIGIDMLYIDRPDKVNHFDYENDVLGKIHSLDELYRYFT